MGSSYSPLQLANVIAAVREAEELGASVLPLPLMGEPFDFELPTLDGKTIRSGDLKGKVVLLDFWATW